MSELVKRLRECSDDWPAYLTKLDREAADALEAQAKRIAELEARAAMLLSACSKMNDEVSQVLGKALRYPRYCDSQDVFPGAVASDGVCVGEHVCQSIADEAAQKIAQLEARLEITGQYDGIAARDETIRLLEAENARLRVDADELRNAAADMLKRVNANQSPEGLLTSNQWKPMAWLDLSRAVKKYNAARKDQSHSANTVGGPTPVMDAAPACERKE